MSEQQHHETWSISKAPVVSEYGLVASQHHVASDIGAEVLGQGGNAIDAAVATSLSIGTLEPWMSGLGGGGFMLVYLAAQDRVYAIDFGMVAPRELDPDDYPLIGGNASDLFGWPAVQEDRNLRGFPAVAVPGYIAGISTAAERFGTCSWAEAIAPAIELAETGMIADWYATLMITTAAGDLSRFPESARVLLPSGYPPVGEWGAPPPRIKLGNLAATLRRLRDAGPRDFYEGEIARSLITDLSAGGNKITDDDLRNYAAQVMPAEKGHYRDATVHVAPGLSAGPTLLAALGKLSDCVLGDILNADTYLAYAESLDTTYTERFETMGDSNDSRAPSCTTHISTVDRDGNFVALTQTLLSLFGSKVMLPGTGVLMNNGIMWFDPQPGRPNSIASGRRPLSNMCPTIVTHNGHRTALGASGGRRIMPAVFQLLSFLADYKMDVGAALAQPRIDVSGSEVVGIDNKLPPSIHKKLAERFEIQSSHHGVYPSLFACPNLVSRPLVGGPQVGAAFIPSPWAKVAAPRM